MIAAPRTSGIFYSDGRIRGDLERHGLHSLGQTKKPQTESGNWPMDEHPLPSLSHAEWAAAHPNHCRFLQKEKPLSRTAEVNVEEEKDGPYKFPDRPAAKSSTGVLVSTPGAIACPKCGCRSLGANEAQARQCWKKGCECKCHESVN